MHTAALFRIARQRARPLLWGASCLYDPTQGGTLPVVGHPTMASGVTPPLDPAELSIPALMRGVWHESVWPLITHCPVVEYPAGEVLISPLRDERVLYLLLG